MFNIENKFMTIGVKENISLDIQLFMWNEIEKRINSKEQVDYLQVFNISIRHGICLCYYIINK